MTIERDHEARPDTGEQQVPALLQTLDLLPNGIIVSDLNGTEVVRNAKARELLSDPQVGPLLNRAIAAGLTGAATGDPAPRILELHGSPVRVFTITARTRGDGGMVVIIEDISQRRQLDAMRRDFVANVSHELRTPIGALSLLIDAVADEDDPAVIERLNDRMTAEVDRARRLVEQLLDLSRIESMGQEDRNRVPIPDVIKAAVESSGPVIAERTAIEMPDEDSANFVVAGNAEELTSAIKNLVDNASKYSSSELPIEIGIRMADAAVTVVVRDYGIGIPTKDLDRIFERFYRVDRARSRDTGGSGLGLAIVRHVVRNHGGEVTVVSREGEGSTFTITLPLAP